MRKTGEAFAQFLLGIVGLTLIVGTMLHALAATDSHESVPIAFAVFFASTMWLISSLALLSTIKGFATFLLILILLIVANAARWRRGSSSSSIALE